MTMFRDGDAQPPAGIHAKARVRRDIAEMLGMAKGVLADGVVNEDESIALMAWADDHPDVAMGWPGNVVYRRLRKIFSDGHASEDERLDLYELLTDLVGAPAGLKAGGTAATALPLDPPSPIEVTDRVFVFTGRFAYGPRTACEEAVRRIGGWPERSLTRRTDYLVVGVFGSRDWVQTSFGGKIEKAVNYRERFATPSIISEEHWVAHL